MDGLLFIMPLNGQTCIIGTRPFIVKAGDTLPSIVKQFGTTVTDIISANPDIRPNRLYVGQNLCVPIPVHTPFGLPGEIKIDTSTNYYVIKPGDTLNSIARYFNVTVQAILKANPNLSPNISYAGQVILIPYAPLSVKISINIRGKRLALFRDSQVVRTYPVATGKSSTPSPQGSFKIINKQVNPGGPYGTRWMGLSIAHYGIHGTNNPSSIGTSASNGCIRMFNWDVNDLFNLVPVGTPVEIWFRCKKFKREVQWNKIGM